MITMNNVITNTDTKNNKTVTNNPGVYIFLKAPPPSAVYPGCKAGSVLGSWSTIFLNAPPPSAVYSGCKAGSVLGSWSMIFLRASPPSAVYPGCKAGSVLGSWSR